jgi:transposase
MIQQQHTFSHDISIQELEYLRGQGFNNKQIAEKVGCSVNTISKYFPKERKEKVKLTEEDYEHMLALYNDEYSPKYIATRYNCCVPTVYRILKKMGIDFSNRKQDDIPEKEMIEENVEEAPAYNPCVDEPKSSCLTMREVKIYSGHSGDYLVDPVVHNIRLPEVCKMMDKKELGFYIRDLMAVWKEM